MPLNLQQLFQLESHLEEAFRDGAVSEGVVDIGNCYISRTTDAARSPRLELKAIIGEVQNHQHLFSDGSFTWDAWAGELEALVVTNRSTHGDTHNAMLGRLRAALMPLYTQAGVNPLARWWQSEVVTITDIREVGTEDSWRDDQDLDYSLVRFALLFNISPSVWPE